MSKLIKRTPN